MDSSVILIDDEPWALKDMEWTFPWTKHGFHVAGRFGNGGDALAAILRMRPCIVCTDIRLLDMSGIELMATARRQNVDSVFIVVSGLGEFELARQAMHYGAIEYCLKPLSDELCDEILLRVRKLLGDAPVIPSAPSDALEAIVDYIRINLQHKLTLESVASHFHISQNTLCRLFRSGSATTFAQYVESERLTCACKLLTATSMSIAEIAETIGYADAFYFSSLFKRRKKATPSQYRRETQRSAPP